MLIRLQILYCFCALFAVAQDLQNIVQDYDNDKDASASQTSIINRSCNRNTARDCSEWKRQYPEAKSGVYPIRLGNNCTGVATCCAKVFCDMDTLGGGWLVFQRRKDGSVDFYRNFEEYKYGFGYLTGEFWLGNMRLFDITNRGVDYELLIQLRERETACDLYSRYSTFRLSDANTYKLDLGRFLEGTAGDGMSVHNGFEFTTFDRDRDAARGNCAAGYRGAWWYNNCHSANLNGRYRPGFSGCVPAEGYGQYISWAPARGKYYSFAHVELKLRPKTFKLHDPTIHEFCPGQSSLRCPDPHLITDCAWYPIEEWSDCDAACGEPGVQKRLREKIGPENFGLECEDQNPLEIKQCIGACLSTIYVPPTTTTTTPAPTTTTLPPTTPSPWRDQFRGWVSLSPSPEVYARTTPAPRTIPPRPRTQAPTLWTQPPLLDKLFRPPLPVKKGSTKYRNTINPYLPYRNSGSVGRAITSAYVPPGTRRRYTRPPTPTTTTTTTTVPTTTTTTPTPTTTTTTTSTDSTTTTSEPAIVFPDSFQDYLTSGEVTNTKVLESLQRMHVRPDCPSGDCVMYSIEGQASNRCSELGPMPPKVGDCRWISLNPRADIDVLGAKIVAYKIHFGGGKWSDWYVPGYNDLSDKFNVFPMRAPQCRWGKVAPLSMRRMWAQFVDHEHKYIMCR